MGVTAHLDPETSATSAGLAARHRPEACPDRRAVNLAIRGTLGLHIYVKCSYHYKSEPLARKTRLSVVVLKIGRVILIMR